MNSTPITSEEGMSTRYTLVSGSSREVSTFQGISVIVLNRGGKPFKSGLLSQLYDLKLREIISVETSRQIFDMEGLASRYDNLKFLMVSETISIGERINIAVKEAAGSHVLVFWNDMNLQIKSQAERFFKQALEGDFLCRVPLLMNTAKETIPTRFSPGFSHKKLEVFSLGAVINKTPTLYPFDYCGIYHRQKFLLSGGYDSRFKNPYWQKLDFGFRVFLWGERIETGTAIKLNYLGDIPRENTTRDSDYRRFFLKNLALKFHGDSCSLPFSHFLQFLFQSRSSAVTAYREYKEIRNWVEENGLRFKSDPFNMTELWEMEE